MAELAQYSQACILNKVNQVAFYKWQEPSSCHCLTCQWIASREGISSDKLSLKSSLQFCNGTCWMKTFTANICSLTVQFSMGNWIAKSLL
jgi:hypothetical protein